VRFSRADLLLVQKVKVEGAAGQRIMQERWLIGPLPAFSRVKIKGSEEINTPTHAPLARSAPSLTPNQPSLFTSHSLCHGFDAVMWNPMPPYPTTEGLDAA